MDVSSNSQASHSVDYAGPPPVLVAASSDRALDNAAAAVEAAGLRLAPVTIDEAADRIAIQVDEDGGAPLDRLLDRIEAEAAIGRVPAVVAAPAALIDPIAARLTDPNVELLVDPTPADRAAALAIATAKRGGPARLHDVASEPSAARLRQLSDEVSRIAATLARLSVGPGSPAANRNEAPAESGSVPAVDIETIRQVIRARRLRARYFDEELFADPAWDMLLDLLQAEIAQLRVPVSSLCIAAAVPATTALRWIKTMTDAGLFLRRADPHDGRRVFIELSRSASDGMRRYFGEVGRTPVI